MQRHTFEDCPHRFQSMPCTVGSTVVLAVWCGATNAAPSLMSLQLSDSLHKTFVCDRSGVASGCPLILRFLSSSPRLGNWLHITPSTEAHARNSEFFFFFSDLFATGVRRSPCRLQLHAVFCEVSVLHAPVQGGSSRTRGKAAGNRGSFVEAGGGEDLAEQGLVAINIGGAGEGKTKETGTEGSGGREGEQGGPTGCEGSNGCRPQRSRHSTGPAASEEANELGGLGTPAATNLKCKDNKSAPLRAHQLRVGAFLSRACEAKSGALVLALVPARSATSIERGNQGGIDSKLRAAPERESICDDLDAAIIEAIGVDVEVAHKNIAGNCSPSLSAESLNDLYVLTTCPRAGSKLSAASLLTTAQHDAGWSNVPALCAVADLCI